MNLSVTRRRFDATILATVLILAATSGTTAAPLTASVTGPTLSGLANAVVAITPLSPHSDTGTPTTSLAIMDQKHKQFVPHVLAIRTGSPVTFPNSDNIRHSVYSFSPAKRFELPLYSGEPAAPVEFETAGVVTLGCNIHDKMIGYIYVSDSPWFGVTDSDGRAGFDVPPGEYSITFWHPYAPDKMPVKLITTVRPQGATVSHKFTVLNPDPREATAAPADNPFRRRTFNEQ